MEKGSVFDLEPAAARWLADTFEAESPQRALLDSLALSAEAESARPGMRRVGDRGSLRDLLSEDKVGDIVRDVASAFPDLPIPTRPGRAQLRAIDALVRQGW